MAALLESPRNVFTPVGRRSFEKWWFAVAIGAVLLGAALRLLPDGLFGGSQAFITFYPVVAMAALLAGAKAGLATTALSALLANHVFLEPHWTFSLANASDWTALGYFLGASAVISLTAGKLRDAQKRERQALEREWSEKVRREGENRLVQVTDIAPVPIAQWDRDRRFKFANEAYARRFGLTAAQCLGKTLPEVVGEQAYSAFRPYIDRVLNGEPLEFDLAVNYEKLGRRHVHCSFLPELGPGRDVIGAIGAITDVTEIKRIEEELRSAALFPEENPSPVVRVGAAGALLYANPTSTGLLKDWNCAVGGSVPDEVRTAVETGLKAGTAQVLEVKSHGKVLSFVAMPIQERGYVNLYGRDVTEQKCAEEQLRRNHETFQNLIENNPMGIYVVDSDFRMRNASRGARRAFANVNPLTGRDLGDCLRQIWVEPFASEAINRFRHVLDTGDSFVAKDTVERRRDTDQVEAYDWRLERVTLPDGRFGVVCYFYDISEQKRVQEALEHSRDKLELLSRTVGTLLTTPDPQQVIESLCNEVRCFLGCDVFFNFLLDPGTQRLKFNACGGVDPRLARKVEGLELSGSLCGSAAQGACRVLAEALQTGDDPRAALVRSLGLRAYACHPLLSAGGEALGTLSFGTRRRDAFSPEDLELMKAVSDHVAVALLRRRSEVALRESEERFRTMADGTPQMIWVHDAQGQQQFVNQAFCKFFGVMPEEMNGDTWREVMHREDDEAYASEFARCLRERCSFHAQVRIRRADGASRWLESFGQPRFSASGEFLGIVGTSTDVTDRKRAEEVLARDKEQLEALVKERTARLQELVNELEHFSYTITHDMRAPLRAMRGFAEVIDEVDGGLSDADRQKFLKRIIVAAERMDALITDALNYSKAVRQELPLAPVDVGRLLRGMLETYPEFQVEDAEISVDPALPLVMGNEAGLTQCFSNLLANAVKFAKPGERPVVRVRCETLSKPGWVRLWVEDNGVGVSDPMKARVFDMFSRGSHPSAGTGIGLALVRKVADRMGGRVGLEAEEGRGSRFWVELRLAGTSDSESAP